MAELLLVSTNDADAFLPSLTLLPHRTRRIPPSPSALAAAPDADALIVDGTADLVAARRMCTLIASRGGAPALLVLADSGLAAVAPEWGVRDIVLRTAGPSEVEARLRLLVAPSPADDEPGAIVVGALVVDELAYAARCRGATLDLTYKEFELLRHLAAHPDQVFTRERLLAEVWGYDYYGGSRTVDVHVRRLRAKLGDADTMIQTVRNVGYRLVSEPGDDEEDAA